MRSSTISLANTSRTALAKQLNTARTLALHGAPAIASELCASAFLEHAYLLATDRDLRRRFVECLLLLGMPHLLARLLRATNGVEIYPGDAEADILDLNFSNGKRLLIARPGPQIAVAERERFAAEWSEAILEAADSEPGPLALNLPRQSELPAARTVSVLVR